MHFKDNANRTQSQTCLNYAEAQLILCKFVIFFIQEDYVNIK